MTARAISLTIVAFLFGALSAGGVGVRVIREVRTVEDATSLPAENVASSQQDFAEYQVDPFESLISSTALIPSSITSGAGDVAITYELVSLAPSMGVESREAAGDEHLADLSNIFPRRWVIETDDGTIEGGPRNPRTQSAVFDADGPMQIGAIESVRIVEALAAFAFEESVILTEAVPLVEVAPGVSVELVGLSSQGSTTTIQIAVHADENAIRTVWVAGVGPGWAQAPGPVDRGATYTMNLSGDAPPQGIPVVVYGTTWVEIDGSFEVNLDGIR